MVLSLAVTIWFVFVEASRVDVAIAEGIPTKAMHEARSPLTLISLSILHDQGTRPMLEVIHDFALIVATAIFIDFLEIWTFFDLLLKVCKAIRLILAH